MKNSTILTKLNKLESIIDNGADEFKIQHWIDSFRKELGSGFQFIGKSQERLNSINPILKEIAIEALSRSKYDIGISCGLRTIEEQIELVSEKKSRTYNSRHLHGCAFDFFAYADGKDTFKLSADRAFEIHKEIANIMMQIGVDRGIEIEWGGYWKNFKDTPHIQLSHKQYPDDPSIISELKRLELKF